MRKLPLKVDEMIHEFGTTSCINDFKKVRLIAAFMKNISKLLYRSPLMSMIVRNDDAVNAIEIIDMEREPLQRKINRSSLLYVFS